MTRSDFVVRCKECKEEHDAEDIETENIEEDEFGRDVLTFVCPNTDNITHSNIFRK